MNCKKIRDRGFRLGKNLRSASIAHHKHQLTGENSIKLKQKLSYTVLLWHGLYNNSAPKIAPLVLVFKCRNQVRFTFYLPKHYCYYECVAHKTISGSVTCVLKKMSNGEN